METHPYGGSTYILLVVVATLVAIGARRFRVPFTVALVLAGLVLGALQLVPAPHLTKELLYAVFLPGLLFEAGFHIELGEFRRNQGVILAFAVPGVVVSMALTAVVLHPLVVGLGIAPGFGWWPALVFGALIGATDPVAVTALLRTLGAPSRLGLILEGESLLNDGTAIVLFGLMLSLALGAPFSLGGVALEFARIVGMGAVIGIVVGAAVSHLIHRITDPMIEISLTTVAAYGSFVLAEQLHDSGVIATVVAGMLCGNYAARTGMSPSTRVAVETFWEYVAFALNSIVFLLIGFEVRLEALRDRWQMILAAYLVVTLARLAVVYGVSALLRNRPGHLPRSWGLVLGWGGFRGGVSMVLALGIPASLSYREMLVTTTFGVVLLTILVQGLTISPLLRRLGLVRSPAGRRQRELARGEIQAIDAAITELDRIERSHQAAPDVVRMLRREYDERLERTKGRLGQLPDDHGVLLRQETLEARRQLLLAEKLQLIESLHQGRIASDAVDQLLADVDVRLVRLEEGRVDEVLDARAPGPPPDGGPAPTAEH